MAQTKLVTVESTGIINELGGIRGPITNPTNIIVPTIIKLINSGKVVYAVNPYNVNEKVRLTRMNIFTQKFTFPVKVKHDQETPKKTVVEPKEVKVKTVAEPIEDTTEVSTTVTIEDVSSDSDNLFESNRKTTTSKKKK